ncbi:3-hydroxybutyryl-CoA dehydrogenase [Nocardia sp. NPDC051787]|uniref:3-hydroxybutyryl-CoA dehydrogenase n=1 Tax=Nocardia sp. NPDC051787 TaxID=3155415 RepID=UPI003446E526
MPVASEESLAATTVGVVGCGLMGSGIAEVFARAGHAVIVHEVDAAAAARGRRRVERSLAKAAASGKLTDGDVEAALDRITFGSDLDALGPVELCIEAASEDATLKLELFQRLDAIIKDEDAILASNTSSVPITRLGTATRRPAQVIGVHFFNPAPVLPLVEVVPGLLTSPDVVRRVRELAERDLGKTVILSKDRAGFVVNALLVPYLLSAVRMVEAGFATPSDIDAGMRGGCAHPMGPLRLADLIGIDTVVAIATSMFAEFKEPLYAPPPMLSRMVDAGLLGRKSGRGFYDYPLSDIEEN